MATDNNTDYYMNQWSIYLDDVEHWKSTKENAEADAKAFESYLTKLKSVKDDFVTAKDNLDNANNSFKNGGYTNGFNSNGNTMETMSKTAGLAQTALEELIGRVEYAANTYKDLVDTAISNYNKFYSYHKAEVDSGQNIAPTDYQQYY